MSISPSISVWGGGGGGWRGTRDLGGGAEGGAVPGRGADPRHGRHQLRLEGEQEGAVSVEQVAGVDNLRHHGHQNHYHHHHRELPHHGGQQQQPGPGGEHGAEVAGVGAGGGCAPGGGVAGAGRQRGGAAAAVRGDGSAQQPVTRDVDVADGVAVGEQVEAGAGHPELVVQHHQLPDLPHNHGFGLNIIDTQII